MQDIIEELLRLVGYATLKIGTLGRYRGGDQHGRLPEGAIGLGVLVGLGYLSYAVLP